MAAPPSSLDLCQQQRDSCDEVVDLADQVIGKQEKTINMLDDQNQRLTRALQDQIAEGDKPTPFFSRPSVVFPVGFVLGIVAGIYATKH